MTADSTVRLDVAQMLAAELDVASHRLDFYLDHYIPSITSQTASSLTIGRVTLPIVCRVTNDSAPFAATAPSLRLIEQIATAVKMVEPVLLVGETGTGKTTTVQRLASSLGRKLTVLNMSQQSDSTDLMGGFKPVDAQMLIVPLKMTFDSLFAATFNITSNAPFIESVQKTYIRKRWDKLMVAFATAIKMARLLFSKQRSPKPEDGKRKIRKLADPGLELQWEDFEIALNKAKTQVALIAHNFMFSFIEGTLVKAVRNGDWILLDEINLATGETLESLSSLLQDALGSLILLERGDAEPIPRHPNFRLFACMNPANDAGKRSLPLNLQQRFTEIWVDSPDARMVDLLMIIKSYTITYLPPGPQGDKICADLAAFYTFARGMSREGRLFDGAGQRVHVSMRTLTRALTFSIFAPIYGLRRSLYEGCYMTFMTGLCPKSWQSMNEMIFKHVLDTVKRPENFIKQIPVNPGTTTGTTDNFELVSSFWIEKGPIACDPLDSHFVLTPSVTANLANLARGVVSRKYPVLIQGPTSAGKTSMVEYLASLTGHRFIRINNHEHTDLQEYIGGYASNSQGALVFQEVNATNSGSIGRSSAKWVLDCP
jgi:midasin